MSAIKIAILFTLGKPDENHEDWQNYLQYGFEKSDEPALIKLLSDQSLAISTRENKAGWAPLHAWRTLGQLRSESAILPLLALFEELTEDDWALNELPIVMGMIGQSALEPLAHYCSEKNYDEYARATAMEGLSEIAKQHPELRGEVLKRYRNYISQADTSAHVLNGLLVSYLLDMDAKELIDDIRELFNRQCVDITCAGDMEDVEMALGLRFERSTPRALPLDFDFDNVEKTSRSRPNTDDIVELIDYLLDRHGGDNAILGASELDGYFAAIACAPQTIMPSLWMPMLWGGEDHIPTWETTEDYQEFNELIMSFYNYVMKSMNEGSYEAMFMEQDTGQQTYTIVDDWCAGFLRGTDIWGPISPADGIILEAALQPIQLFATERGYGELADFNDDEIEQRQQKIGPAVRKLFLHFFERRQQHNQPVVHGIQKTGRNDPCSCGSGKKYKKCCLH